MGSKPRRGDVEARQLAALDPIQERCPAVDLPLVEAVGTPEIFEALGAPVDLREQCDALHQLVREPGAGVEVGVERGRPALRQLHRRPSVDEAHQIERSAQHRGVLAHRDRR